jgi:hypothetical protein
MAKAINDGTCQICGCRQRLPNGRLAKHGYAVRWNMFVGGCSGSGELPFEQSTGLIERAIHAAKAEAAGLLDNAAEQRAKGSAPLSALPAERKTMFSVYFPATFTDRHSKHEWKEVDILEAEGRFFVEVDTRDMNGRQIKKRENLYGTLAGIIKAGREGYAYFLEQRSKKFAEYARWQESRIEGWKPAPLLERLGGR